MLSNKKQSNNLEELKKFLEEDNEIAQNSNSIAYNYNLKINLYKENTENGIVRVNPSTVMNAFGMKDMIEARK